MRTLAVALGLLALGWAVLGVGLVADARRGAPEATIRDYLADLEAHRVDAALAALEPDSRNRWREFLEFQQFNRYSVVSIAVRSPSLVEVLTRGVAWRPTQVTLIADILEPSGIRWRGSTIVRVRLGDGRWLLERPPFAPD
jgi:hypothetical protein